jgi:hypothetical protein
MKTRLIEMYVGYSEGSWNTTYVDIPLDTADEDIEKVSIAVAKKTIKDYVFVGLYNITEIDED